MSVNQSERLFTVSALVLPRSLLIQWTLPVNQFKQSPDQRSGAPGACGKAQSYNFWKLYSALYWQCIINLMKTRPDSLQPCLLSLLSASPVKCLIYVPCNPPLYFFLSIYFYLAPPMLPSKPSSLTTALWQWCFPTKHFTSSFLCL